MESLPAIIGIVVSTIFAITGGCFWIRGGWEGVRKAWNYWDKYQQTMETLQQEDGDAVHQG